MEEAEMRETVVAEVGSHHGLERARDAEEVCEFVNGVVLRDQHQRADPDENTAQVQGQARLDAPLSSRDVPGVPGDLVSP